MYQCLSQHNACRRYHIFNWWDKYSVKTCSDCVCVCVCEINCYDYCGGVYYLFIVVFFSSYVLKETSRH